MELFLDLFHKINDLVNFYNEYFVIWSQKDYIKLNFSKKLVIDLKNNYMLLEDIKKINSMVVDEMDCKNKFKVFGLYRIKNNDSIIIKIKRYCNNEHKGSFPIKKCLNDLIGFRYILDCEYDLSFIKNKLEEYKNKHLNDVKIKILEQNKNGYNAIHFYIQKNNLCLPWELQIWRKKDIKNNDEAHFKKYGRY